MLIVLYCHHPESLYDPTVFDGKLLGQETLFVRESVTSPV